MQLCTIVLYLKSQFLDCIYPNWVGDDFCDDENNYPHCNYDGGDCCVLPGGNVNTAYCSECACLDPNPFPPAFNFTNPNGKYFGLNSPSPDL